MNELGHILREAREARGLTLAEVESETRINARFLAALEEGEYETLPTPVHVRGFLRNYSRFLGLDPQPLLDRYALYKQQTVQQDDPFNQEAQQDDLPQKPLNLPDSQPFFDPVNVEVSTQQPSRSSESFVRVLIIGALLVMLYLIGTQFLPRVLDDAPSNAELGDSINTAVNDLLNRETPTPEPDAELDAAVTLQPSSVLTSTGRNIFPTASPTRPALPATLDEIRLRVDITERTFMEVTIDGDIVFSGNALRDDTFEWVAQEEATIVTGNGIGVNVTINDIDIGRLGDRGQSVEETWRTTN